jgi:hypothetical protein
MQTLLYALDHKAHYEDIKEQQINSLINDLAKKNISDLARYDINRKLYLEYKAYKIDSAVLYLEKNLEIAKQTKQNDLYFSTVLSLSFMYWQSGNFLEATQMLHALDLNELRKLPVPIQADYYDTFKQIYRYYAEMQSDKSNDYFRKSNLYRDSILLIAYPESQIYKLSQAEKLSEDGHWDKAATIITDLLNSQEYKNSNYAILASILANIYKHEGNSELQKRYFAISALGDIQNAIKENSAMLQLALLLYHDNEINDAYRCIKSALDDAEFCKARFRNNEVAAIFPIIDHAYHEKTTRQHHLIFIYFILVSLLSTLLIIAIVYIYIYLKRIGKIRIQLAETNDDLQIKNLKLNELNVELTALNRKLSQTNIVKEAYLTKFIDLCSNYIDKLDNYRRSLHRLARDGKSDELNAELKSSKFIENELSDFYTNFDETFLRIFPTFISDFNALFPAEKHQTIKQGEILNTDLRIFALIRLGITDSQKIASFLRCSITTVYTYRSKLKNHSLFKDNLEEQILKIGA